jgi:hypothetical protein
MLPNLGDCILTGKCRGPALSCLRTGSRNMNNRKSAYFGLCHLLLMAWLQLAFHGHAPWLVQVMLVHFLCPSEVGASSAFTPLPPRRPRAIPDRTLDYPIRRPSC